MGLKALGSKWANSSLILRILIFLIIGVVLALIWPVAADGTNIITLFGTWFVAGLKGVAPVLVLFLVASALANAKKGEGNMKTIIVLYLISTVVAALVAVLASYAFPTVLELPSAAGIENTSPEGVGQVLGNLILNIFSNPINALMNANYIGILAWGVALGIALRAASDGTKNVFANVAEAITKIVRWVIQLAPFGIMGLVYQAVSTSGIEIFTTYGRLVLVLVACMLFIALVTNPIIVFICTKKNPYPLVLRCLKDSGLTAFFTRSSAANIPVNMTLCDKLGLNKDNYSVSIPLGATINMAGAAVTIAVMSMAAAHTLGISVDFPTALILCVLAALSACGASGVAGGSLLLIPLACSLFGIGNDIAMEVVAIGFIIGVIQDSCETALNSSSDVLLTATAEYRARAKAGISIENMGKDAAPLDIQVTLDGKLVEKAPEAAEAIADAVE